MIINAEETPYDEIADVVLHEQLADVLPGLAARL